MSLWRQLAQGLRVLGRRRAADRDLEDELGHYLEQAAAEHRARGLSPEEARRTARLEVGSSLGLRQQVREGGWEHRVETVLADLRYAGRRLRATPAFTGAAVLTLALGIGATTAIWSALDPILLEPLPYPDPDRLVTVWDRADDGSRLEVTFGTHRELAQRARSFAALAVYKAWHPSLSGGPEPERLTGQSVSADYFRALGVAPALGRDLEAGDDHPGAAAVVLLSHRLWQRRFGGDPAILGRAITLEDEPHTVVGVLPASFENVLEPAAELWRPLRYDLSLGAAWGHHLRMAGRLRPGIGVEDAGRELAAIAGSPLPELPRAAWAALEEGMLAVPLKHDLTGAVRPTLLAIFGAALLVLAIAAVNVTHLLLARGVRRRGELALRTALGAGGGRLMGQLLGESLLLAAMGGAGGLIVAAAGVRAMVGLSPPDLPRLGAIAIDARALAFTFALTTLVGLACGLAPALQARRDPRHDLERASQRAGGGHRRLRSWLVAAEVALALVLLVGSGLLQRSLGRLFAVEAGFDAAGLLTLRVETHGLPADERGAAHEFFDRALAAVRRVPGVAGAGFTSQLPLSGEIDRYGVHLEWAPAERPEGDRGAFRYAVSPGYLETMGIALRRGRSLAESDRAGSPRVVVISEMTARRRFPGLEPLGQRLTIGPSDGGPFTVVGIVADVKQVSLALPDADAVYVPASQWHVADDARSFVIRSHGEPAALAGAVRRAIWSVNADQPIVRLATMEHLLAATAGERRLALLLFTAFALTALILAAAGLYGLIAGSVAEHTREIGVRSALGASRAQILGQVVRQALAPTTLGAALGLAGAAAATEAIRSLLYGISNLDPATYLGVVALLGAVATAASALPAWRAACIDPASTLRAP